MQYTNYTEKETGQNVPYCVSPEHVSRLKQYLSLFPGAQARIAEATDVTPATVSNVLSGKYYSEKVLAAAVKYLKAREKAARELEQEIQSLTQSTQS